MSATEIVEQIRKLPPEERREVVEQLREEFAGEDVGLTPEETAELERRAEDALGNPGRGRPAGQIFAEIATRLSTKGWVSRS